MSRQLKRLSQIILRPRVYDSELDIDSSAPTKRPSKMFLRENHRINISRTSRANKPTATGRSPSRGSERNAARAHDLADDYMARLVPHDPRVVARSSHVDRASICRNTISAKHNVKASLNNFLHAYALLALVSRNQPCLVDNRFKRCARPALKNTRDYFGIKVGYDPLALQIVIDDFNGIVPLRHINFDNSIEAPRPSERIWKTVYLVSSRQHEHLFSAKLINA